MPILIIRHEAIIKYLGFFALIVVGLLPSYSQAAATDDGADLNLQKVADDSNLPGLPDPKIKTPPSKPRLSVSVKKKPAVLTEDENNTRLLEVSVDKYKFDELLMVYQQGDVLYVPFGTLNELIDLAIKADPATGIASGFVFKEKKTFYLDINRGEVALSGVMKSFDNSRTAARLLDDIYIDSNLLSEWLPLKIDVDLYASRLKITPDFPLPFQ